jgi:hypothetical protein
MYATTHSAIKTIKTFRHRGMVSCPATLYDNIRTARLAADSSSQWGSTHDTTLKEYRITVMNAQKAIIIPIVTLIIAVVAYQSAPLMGMWLCLDIPIKLNSLSLSICGLFLAAAYLNVRREVLCLKTNRTSPSLASFNLGGIAASTVLALKFAIGLEPACLSDDWRLLALYVPAVLGMGFVCGGVATWIPVTAYRALAPRRGNITTLGCGKHAG